TYSSTGNGQGIITLNPALSANQGVYNNITIKAADQHGGSGTTSFNLTVNSNYDPVVAPISAYTMNEGDTISINLSATDQNAGDILSWSVRNLPAGFVLPPGANGFASLSLRPSFAAEGSYAVQVQVNDGNGGTGTQQFNLTENQKAPPVTQV